jgi:DNA mismatch repair protein MutL
MNHRENGIKPLVNSVASVLKAQTNIPTFSDAISETIQNSIDSRSTKITVTVDPATLSFTVVDNGTGIQAKDLPYVGCPYYTSKCSDLVGITESPFLGFRGEALASIAATSYVTITSRASNSMGTYTIHARRGSRFASHVVSEEDAFASPGTIVSVNCLHSSLPVRYKMMSSQQTLSNHITPLKQALFPGLLSRPMVSLKVTDNASTTLLAVPSVKKLRREVQLLNCLYGGDIGEEWVSVSSSEGAYTLQGVVVSSLRPAIGAQFIIINSRLAKIPQLYKVANSLASRVGQFTSKRTKLSKTTSAMKDSSNCSFVLSITGPLSISDLLCEPSKSLTQLENVDIISHLITLSLEPLLGEQSLPESPRKKPSQKSLQRPALPVMYTKATEHENYFDHFSPFFSKENLDQIKTMSQKISKPQLAMCRVISQLDHKFIMIKVPGSSNQEPASLIIVDQHAADERIRVERLTTQFLASDELKLPNLLDVPMVITLSWGDIEILNEHRSSIERWVQSLNYYPTTN